jgi:NDP-sugar pyrophosphorylase family protein
VKAIVLAAGLGTRLAPLTPRLPKALVPVLNRPVLSHILRGLATAEITQVGVIIGPHTTPLRHYYADGHPWGVALTWLSEPTPLGSGGSLRAHRGFFDGQPALVVTCDMLTGVDLQALIAQHHRAPATVTVAAALQDPHAWTGDIILADGIHGRGYLFKPGPNASSSLGSCGTWIVDPTILDSLPPDRFIDFSQHVLPTLPSTRYSLHVFDAGAAHVTDYGQFDRLRDGNLTALHGTPAVPIPGQRRTGDIWCEQGCQISDLAQLHGPVVIGQRVRIQPHAIVHGPAVIGHQATISQAAAVVASVVLPGTTITGGTLIAGAVYGHPDHALFATLRHRAADQ